MAKTKDKAEAPSADTPATPPAPESPWVAPKNIDEAKLRIMEEVPYIQKDNQGKKGVPYSFLSEGDLVEKLHVAFTRNQITIEPGKPELLQGDAFQTAGGKMCNHAMVCLPFTLVHSPSNTKSICWGLGEGADLLDKAGPKAMTQAYKYMLRQTFMIITGDDPDWHDSSKTPRIDPEAPENQKAGNLPKTGSGPAGGAPGSGKPAQNGTSTPQTGQNGSQRAPAGAAAPPPTQLGDGKAEVERLNAEDKKQYNRVSEAIRKSAGPKGSRAVLLKYRKSMHERNFSAALVACLETYWWLMWKETPRANDPAGKEIPGQDDPPKVYAAA